MSLQDYQGYVIYDIIRQSVLILTKALFYHASGILVDPGAGVILNMSRTRSKAVSEGNDSAPLTALEAKVWVKTVTEGERRFLAA